ncbi:hypothetical protein J4209_02155 [Candidatus Woesearchaeota archaeon]|nr:hypothetical protein [Candidatus Woesearchaeota archaeon]
MNKSAIELSVNFIVIVIISLIVFGMGIYLVNMFFGGAEKIKKDVDAETKNKITELLDDGSRIAIPFDRLVIKKSSSDVFGVGVLNILDSDATFAITLTPSIYVNSRGERSPDWPTGSNVLLPAITPIEIKVNEREVFRVPVRVDRGTPSGTYVINVFIDQYSSELYKLYVIVPA